MSVLGLGPHKNLLPRSKRERNGMTDNDHHEAMGAMIHRGIVEANTHAASGAADTELIALLAAASCRDPCHVKSIKAGCSCAGQIAAAYRIQALTLDAENLRAALGDRDLPA